MISISIIVPVYGVEKHIERCLRSVFRQNYDGFIECILVDDCTPDNSIAIAKELIADYSGKIVFKILRNDVNKGLSITRNIGFAASSADYVFFLDSDDELMADSISTLASLAMKYPGVDLVCGDWYVSRRHRVLQTEPSLPEYIDKKSIVSAILLEEGKLSMTAPNKLFRRDFLIDNNLKFRPGIYHEDELFNFYLAESASSLAISHIPTYFYYLNTSGITADEYTQRRLSDLLSIVEEILDEGKTIFRCPAALRLLCIIARGLTQDSALWSRTKALMKKAADPARSFGFYRIYFYLLKCRFSSYKRLKHLINYRKVGRLTRKTFKTICKHQ